MSLDTKGINNNRLCRICLKVVVSNEIIIGGEGSWLQLYEFCFGISIRPEDVSRKLCIDCSNKLTDFAEFKKLAARSDKLWQYATKVRENCFESNVVFGESMKQEHIEETSNDNNDCDDFVSTEIEAEDSKLTYECFEVKKESLQGNDTLIKTEYEQPNTEPTVNTIQIEKNKKFYICDNCSKPFCSKLQLKKHINTNCKALKIIKTKSLSEVCYYCGLCDVTTSDEQQLKLHVTEHSINNDLGCKLCDYVGRDFADMTSHRYSHMPNGIVSKKICHIVTCKKKFNVELALQYHYRVVHLKKTGGLCSVCNKQFGSYKSWRNHERLHKTENFVCDICGMKFLFRNQIVSHMEIHSDYNGFICDICGKGFKRNSNLKLHLSAAHDFKKVKCKHCNKMFKNEMRLRCHLQRVTLGTLYQCEVCSKSYSHPSALKTHMIWHKDERPFVCNICGFSYKANSQLKIHMRKHTGNLPFKCEHCSKCFPSSGQLKVHVTTHTGLKSHKCLHCAKSFHGKKQLLEHCAKRHNEGTDTGQKEAEYEVSIGDDNVNSVRTNN